MVGDVLCLGRNFKQRRPSKVLHGHHHVPDMSGVLCDEAISEIVNG